MISRIDRADVWNATTFLCDFLPLFCVVSPLCVVVTSLCCVASSLCVAVASLRFVVSSWCLVMQSWCDVVLSWHCVITSLLKQWVLFPREPQSVFPRCSQVEQIWGSRGNKTHCILWGQSLRTFALIVSAHPYCARKSTCHVMPRHATQSIERAR